MEARVIPAKIRMAKGPATHPNWAVLHASDNTPAPITPVIMCAVAVHIVPLIHSTELNTIKQSFNNIANNCPTRKKKKKKDKK